MHKLLYCTRISIYSLPCCFVPLHVIYCSHDQQLFAYCLLPCQWPQCVSVSVSSFRHFISVSTCFILYINPFLNHCRSGEFDHGTLSQSAGGGNISMAMSDHKNHFNQVHSFLNLQCYHLLTALQIIFFFLFNLYPLD